MNKLKNIFLIVLIIGTISCSDDFLETPLRDGIPAEDALQTSADAQMLLNSIYDVTANYLNGRAQVLSELLGDNFTPTSNADYSQVFSRNTDVFNGTTNGFYKEPYIAIHRANLIMESFDEITGLTDASQTQLEAEAKFLRALGHYNIVLLYAQPTGQTADNSHLGIALRSGTGREQVERATVAEAYALIIADLKFAEQNLPESNDVYATSWAAKALLARVYFQMNDYSNAGAYASEVINSSSFSFDAGDGLNSRFGETISTEHIFTIASTVNIVDGAEVIDNRSTQFKNDYQSEQLRVRAPFWTEIQARTDNRSAWFEVMEEGTENEYVVVTKYSYNYAQVPYLHITEMKLIRAESLAKQGTNLPSAVSEINDIRTRAGVELLNTSATAGEIVDAARLERRIELVGEGNRGQDLKRIGAAGEDVFVRNAPWNCPGMIIQFPDTEIRPNFPKNKEKGCN